MQMLPYISSILLPRPKVKHFGWLSCLLVGFSCLGTAHCFAQLDIPVYQPPGLANGEQYRIVFLTFGTMTAESSDIEDYNALARSEAAQETSLVKSIADRFTAIVSTEDVDARDNTNTNDENGDPSVPIYVLNGSELANNGLIAENNADFYDGENPIGVTFFQDGLPTSFESSFPVVGSNDDGTGAPGNEAGQADVAYSALAQTEGLRFSDDTFPATRQYRVLGLSDVLTAIAEPEPEPEPENSFEAVADVISDVEELLADAPATEVRQVNYILDRLRLSQQDQYWLQPAEDRLSSQGGTALSLMWQATAGLLNLSDPRADAVIDKLMTQVIQKVVDAEIEFATGDNGRPRNLNRAIRRSAFADRLYEEIDLPFWAVIFYRSAWLNANFSTLNR